MKPGNQKTTLILVLATAWALAVLAGYYLYHKPLEPGLLAAPLGALLDVAGAFGMLLIIGGVGRRILPAGKLQPLERFAIQAAVGMGALSFFWLMLGFLHLIYRWTPLVILACLPLVWKPALAWLMETRALGSLWRWAGSMERWLAGIGCLLIGYQLLLALCPPTRWDALTYHLQLPRLFLHQASLHWIPANPYWGQAQIGEMLYTWAVAFFRPQTAAVFGWMGGVVLILGVGGFSAAHAAWLPGSAQPDARIDPAPAAGFMAMTALLCSSTVRGMLSWGYNDLFASLMGLAALICLFAWLDDGQSRHLLWMGVFIGLAAGVKVTAGILAPALYLVVLLKRAKMGVSIRSVALSVLAAGLVFCPWALKNWAETGNPLYPYFTAAHWTASANSAGSLSQAGWLDGLLLPLAVTWRGVEGGQPFGADVGPLLLLFGLPGLWMRRKCAQAQVVFWSMLFGWAAIFVGGALEPHLRQPRLVFVLLPAAALACGWGWAGLQGLNLSGVRLRRVAGFLALLVLGLALWQDATAFSRQNPLAVVMGVKPRESYLDDTLGWYAPAMRALDSLPPESKILLLWEPRALYAPFNVDADLWLDHWRTGWAALGNAPAVLDSWKRQGYTHMMIFQVGADFIRSEGGLPPAAGWEALEQLLKSLPAPQSIGDVYYLYALAQ